MDDTRDYASNEEAYIILVDENDNEIGYEKKIRVHELGKLHRAFSVFVFREYEGEVQTLLQQRQFDKYHCAGLWANTCCSHPHKGEDVLSAANRRLKEEMGLELALQYQGKFKYRAPFENGLVEHEIDHVFVAHYNGEEICPNDREVAAVRWMSIAALKTDCEKNPSQYAPWLMQALSLAYNP